MKNINKILQDKNCDPNLKRIIKKYSSEMSEKDFNEWIENIARLFLKCRNRS